VKASVLAVATTTKKLVKINLTEQTNLLPRDKVAVGIAAKSLMSKAKASELQKMNTLYMMECRKFLVAAIQKILGQSPLKYKATRAVSCLNPVSILSSHTTSETRLAIFWNSCMN